MAQVVITEFQLKIDQYLQELEKLKTKVKSVISEREKDKQAEQRNVKELENASQQRQRLLQQELNLLKKLQSDRAKAFTVKEIEQYNQKIAESQRNIKTLQGATSDLGGVAGKLKGAFTSLGAGIAAAFSAQAIINFSKQAVDAFLEAQKSAELLKFAIIDIGGESEAQFNRLIRQSERVQKTTIFGDDQIQQAQAALASFGLTTNQIEDLIPKLADMATVLNTDIVGAANQVGAGLQGAGREFKRLGIDVSSSKTELENLKTILEGAGRFAGSAANAANTLSGQLEQQKNRASDLQEEIGSRLAPTWVKLKNVFLDATKALLNYSTIQETKAKKSIDIGFDAVSKATEQLKQQGNSNEQIIQILDRRVEAEEKRTKALEQSFEAEKQSGKLTVARAKELEKQIEINKGIVEGYKTQAESLREIESQNYRTIKSEELKQYTLIELNAILTENKKLNDIVAQSNVKLLEKEIELRNKAAEDAKKKLEQTRQELLRQEQAILNVINKARLEQATPEEKLRIQFEIDKASLEKTKNDLRNIAEIEKSIEANKLEAKRLLNEKYTNDIAAELEKQLLAEQKAADEVLKERLRITEDGQKLINAKRLEGLEEGSTQALEVQKQILKEEYDNKVRNIEATVKNELDANQQIELAKIELAGKLSKIDKQIADNSISENERSLQKFISVFEKIADYAQQVFTNLATIQINASQQRIEQLTIEGEAQQAALDKEIESLNKQRQGKYIGEKTYQEKLNRLQEQKLANEKKIQTEINKEKRKQAEIERSLRIFEIAINTASGIMNAIRESPLTFGQPWASFIAALGALQTAAVLSAPLPKFEKGTKRKKDSGLAIVGEKGQEVVNLPAGSQVLHNKGYKKHKEAINAMMDNRFEEYVFTKFVIPEIRKIREKSAESKKQEQKEIYLTAGGIDEYGMRRVAKDGMRISNAQEIAELIASQMQTDIRRRL